jgi:hypothetical protein
MRGLAITLARRRSDGGDHQDVRSLRCGWPGLFCCNMDKGRSIRAPALEI